MLVVDVGNSRVKWARAGSEGLTDHGGEAYALDTLAAGLDRWWGRAARPDRVVVCNVAGAAVSTVLADWVRAAWSLEIELVAPAARALGVTCAYDDPARLGVDRWMALIAARRSHTGPVLVLDCGTAITLDALRGDGRHLGGLIVPGLDLMRRSLLERTDGIADAGGVRPPVLARTTGDAVATGTLLAAVSLVDRVAADLERALGARPRCVATGGDVDSLVPHLARPCRVEADLVLRGLAAVAEAGR